MSIAPHAPRSAAPGRLVAVSSLLVMAAALAFGVGGGGCSGCAAAQQGFAGTACTDATTCFSQRCTGGTCAAPTCSDGIRNGQESDTDCGHVTTCVFCDKQTACGPCDVGKLCIQHDDCGSRYCKPAAMAGGASQCAAATCGDGVSNQDETGIDCGGAHCPVCPAGMGCAKDADCATHLCALDGDRGICVEPPHDLAGIDAADGGRPFDGASPDAAAPDAGGNDASSHDAALSRDGRTDGP